MLHINMKEGKDINMIYIIIQLIDLNNNIILYN